MKSLTRYFFIGLPIVAGLCGGCASSKKEVASGHRRAAGLPQLVRFFRVDQIKLKPDHLFILGRGSAAADGGKNTFTARGLLSGYPTIEMTIESHNPAELNACMQQVQTVQEDHRTVDIRGTGIFTIKSKIDPPIDTGVFVITQLSACGAAGATPAASPPVISSAAIAAAQGATAAEDLAAVPERYLDRSALITGTLVSSVHFKEPVSSFTIGDNGQSLSAFFLTQSLSAESRLALVHSVPGSILVLEGTLTRWTHQSLAAQSDVTTTAITYEFDVSKVVFPTATK